LECQWRLGSSFYQSSKGFSFCAYQQINSFSTLNCILALKFFDILSQKAPDTGELVTLGVAATKPFAVVGIISGMLCIVKVKKQSVFITCLQ